jgi:predicted transcriptional regulator
MSKGKRARPSVTDAELAVLEVLWKGGPLSIRRIADELYPGGRTSDYATVQKLLERLESKGCVARDRSSFAHLFETRIERHELIDRKLDELAEKLCEGSFTPLLLHLVEKRRLSKEDREMLRKLLEEEG